MAVRKYTGEGDLAKILAFTVFVNTHAGDCILLHVGDVVHRFFNALRNYQKEDVVRIWENEQGEMTAWGVVYPHFGTFDYIIHPDQAGGPLEAEVVLTMERNTAQWMRQTDHPGDVGVDVFECDTKRRAIVEAQGYTNVEQPMTFTTQSLDHAIPMPTLPDGFSIRSAAGVHEAGGLGEVHNGAFGAGWTPEEYQGVMESPGYEVERELVVVAPDGRFAAFLIYWLDEVNKSGLFEPVGAHSDFRRMGLTRALMLEGLQRMKTAGMQRAMVSHLSDNEAARNLYEGVGFRRTQRIYFYTKPLLLAASDED